MLSAMIFGPIVGAVLLLLLPAKNQKLQSGIFVAAGSFPLLVGLYLLQIFDRSNSNPQFVEQISWIPSLRIEYLLGADGLSFPMGLLAALLGCLSGIASLSISSGRRTYFFLFLILESCMMGVFFALDLFLFLIFFELQLIPMFFLIGNWGGKERIQAAVRFFLYSLFGSVFLILAFLGIYFTSEPHTFNLMQLTHSHAFFDKVVPVFGMMLPLDRFLWVGLFLGFAIKVPIFPFHTWLPWAHVEAPTAVSVLLAGVLLKMGTYGLLRFNIPLLPEATQWATGCLALLGVINIVYGALCALAQSDLKKMVAYSSISHMGYVLLGIASFTVSGMNGAVLEMVNHGTSTAMLFLLVGVLYDRAHHRWITKPDGTPGFGGLSTVAPQTTTLMALAVFASLGLPALNGFLSEALIFFGAFSVSWLQGLVVFASLGLVLGAAYLLWMFLRVFLGPLNQEHANFPDLGWRERVTLLPLAGLVVALGIYPKPALDLMGATVAKLVTYIH